MIGLKEQANNSSYDSLVVRETMYNISGGAMCYLTYKNNATNIMLHVLVDRNFQNEYIFQFYANSKWKYSLSDSMVRGSL